MAVRHEDGRDAFDFTLALFMNVLAMRDWLIASKPDLEAPATALFRRSSNLALVRDAANGAKHMDITAYAVDGASTVAREYVGLGECRYVVPRSGQSNREVLELADASIGELRAFMDEHGLL